MVFKVYVIQSDVWTPCFLLLRYRVKLFGPQHSFFLIFLKLKYLEEELHNLSILAFEYSNFSVSIEGKPRKRINGMRFNIVIISLFEHIFLIAKFFFL